MFRISELRVGRNHSGSNSLQPSDDIPRLVEPAHMGVGRSKETIGSRVVRIFLDCEKKLLYCVVIAPADEICGTDCYQTPTDARTGAKAQRGFDPLDGDVSLTRSAPEPLQVRMGLATGLAVVGDLIGSGAAQEQAVIGDTPNLAARLQAVAGPVEIVIPENARRLVGNLFEYDSLGQVEIRGLAAPVLAFRVLRESGVGSRFEALRTRETPLVGRDEEVELLSRRWAQAKAGRGQVVLISAEAGIGKSRLAEAFRLSLEGEPHTRLRYFCSPHHQDSALFPFIA